MYILFIKNAQQKSARGN